MLYMIFVISNSTIKCILLKLILSCFLMLFSLSSYHEYGFHIITINSEEYIRESETMPA